MPRPAAAGGETRFVTRFKTAAAIFRRQEEKEEGRGGPAQVMQSFAECTKEAEKHMRKGRLPEMCSRSDQSPVRGRPCGRRGAAPRWPSTSRCLGS